MYSSRTHEEKFWRKCERKCACSKVMSTCCALPRHGEMSKWIWVKDGKTGDVLSQVIFLVCRWLELLKLTKVGMYAEISQTAKPECRFSTEFRKPKALGYSTHFLTQAASTISFLKLVCSTNMYLLLRLNLVPRTEFQYTSKSCEFMLTGASHCQPPDITAGLLLLLVRASGVGCWCLGFELIPTKSVQSYLPFTSSLKSVIVFCFFAMEPPAFTSFYVL